MYDLVIDITRPLYRKMAYSTPTGTDRVSLEYIRHFKNRATALIRLSNKWIELSPTYSKEIFDWLLSPSQKSIFSIPLSLKLFVLNKKSYSKRKRFLLNTGHWGLDKSHYGLNLQKHNLKGIFFVYDLIPITYPEYGKPGEAAKHRSRINTMLQIGHGLLSCSQDTFAILKTYALEYNFSIPPLKVVPLAAARLPPPSSQRPLKEPYFVMLGTIEPRKNHWLLLQVWKQLVEQFGSATPPLVIIGKRGKECEYVVDLLERCEILKPFVLEKFCCKDAEVVTWLAHACALLFPSFAEGYGIPLAEALGLGTPVLASPLLSFSEIAGDIPEYIDPLDARRWKELIIDYVHPESKKRSAQCERMKQFTPPTWDAHFEQVEAFMEHLNAFT